MKWTIPALFLLFLAPQLFAQDSTFKFQVSFTDKNNNPYSLDRPLEFLSAEAMERRENQGILLDSLDLPVTPTYLAQLRQMGVRVLFVTRWFNSAVVALEDSSLLADIQSLPFVKGVEYRGTAEGMEINMADTDTNLFLPGKRNYGQSFNQIQMMNGQWLHEQGFQGAGMRIAVLDAGFTRTNQLLAFADLNARNGIVGTHDFYQDTASVYNFASHGTYVLSVMAGNLPGALTGTAPAASYLLLRTEEGATEYLTEEIAWAAGAEYADSAGAWLINSSLGYHFFDDSTMNHTYEMFDGNTTIITRAADLAASRGILVVSSAGNQGDRAFGKITAPSDADSILAVGAVIPEAEYAGFSSRGPSADGRVKPEIAAQGAAVESASLDDLGTVPINGTSLAAPLVTGLAACLWQAFPELSNMQIRDAIIRSASQYNQPDIFLGYGIPDFHTAFQICRTMTGEAVADEHIISVYPNPFSHEFYASFFTPGAADIEVRLTDRTGRVLERWQISSPGEGTLNHHFRVPENVSHGIYFLSFQSNENVYTRKVLKL
ncbi:MAG: S8 family peptidase [Bacteroidia bacterium]